MRMGERLNMGIVFLSNKLVYFCGLQKKDQK